MIQLVSSPRFHQPSHFGLPLALSARRIYGVVAAVVLAFTMTFGAVAFTLPAFAQSVPAATSIQVQQPDYWSEGPLAHEADPEFQYHYTRGAADWVAAVEHGGVVHLLFGFPALIQRYDMETESWLAEVALTGTPTAMAISANGIYVAFGTELRSYDLDGSNETAVGTSPFTVDEMLVDGDFLFVNTGSQLAVVEISTGATLDQESYFYSMQGLSIAPGASKLYARSVGISPSDIVEMTYAVDGTLGSQDDSPFHGDYPSAVKTWVFPAEDRIADNSGVVYTAPLGYGGSLAGPFDDLAFHAAGSVVLRGSTLYGLGGDMLEDGRADFVASVSRIFVHDDTVYGFYTGAKGGEVETMALASLVPLDPGPPMDPVGLAFTPDQVILGDDNVVFLLSKTHKSIFRWSKLTEDWVATIPLAEEPTAMAFSRENNTLYLTYDSGRMTHITFGISLVQPPSSETSWANSPQTPCGLATAGEWVFICDPSGAWVSHFTYSSAGALVSQEEWNYYSEEYVWNATNRKMYHLRDSTSPNDLLWEDIDEMGVIGDQMDSPLHSSTGMSHPIRLPESGAVVLLGSGRYHNAQTLELLDEIGTTLTDARWLGGKLVTLHPNGSGASELRFWNSFLAAVDVVEGLSGDPIALIDMLDGSLVAVTSQAGAPAFTVVEGPFFFDGFESGDTSSWALP